MAFTLGAVNSKAANPKELPIEDALANIREAIELYLETLPDDERDALLSREIHTTSIEVHA